LKKRDEGRKRPATSHDFEKKEKVGHPVCSKKEPGGKKKGGYVRRRFLRKPTTQPRLGEEKRNVMKKKKKKEGSQRAGKTERGKAHLPSKMKSGEKEKKLSKRKRKKSFRLFSFERGDAPPAPSENIGGERLPKKEAIECQSHALLEPERGGVRRSASLESQRDKRRVVAIPPSPRKKKGSRRRLSPAVHTQKKSKKKEKKEKENGRRPLSHFFPVPKEKEKSRAFLLNHCKGETGVQKKKKKPTEMKEKRQEG